MSEFQKPYPASVTDDAYRRIFHPKLSCVGCFHNWRAKDAVPCCVCTRVPAHLRNKNVPEGGRTDYFTEKYEEL